MELSRVGAKQYSISTGHKVIEPMLPAMPIQIIYHTHELDYSLEWRHGKAQFRSKAPEEYTPGWDLFHIWDSYDLRDNFFGLKKPEDALDFLNISGCFRFRRDGFQRGANLLTWEEIQGWQKLLLKIRLLDVSEWFPRIGTQISEAKHLFLKSDFWTDESEEFLESMWRVAQETFQWLLGIPEGLAIRRDMYLSSEERKAIFATPGANVRGSPEWHGAMEVYRRERAKRARGNSEGKQKLLAEINPTTTLNAILATIYVEKLQGLEVQVCALKECNQTFAVESDHGKKYCSNYHAHLASVRRRRAEMKKQGKKAKRKEKAK